MTLTLSKQFGRAMKRAKRENAKLDSLSGVSLWLVSKRHDKTCSQISELTKRVKALKARRALLGA